ncbi:MAG TPA: hypothetical protein DDY98_06545 [Ruminococcaceae bacterium]|nr:hypothetical protein [Oscillospiraceae bacterium]
MNKLEEIIVKLLGWTYGQKHSFVAFKALLYKLACGKIPFRRIAITIFALIQLFLSACFRTPQIPCGEELDLSGYVPVFTDEFVGNELNTDVWNHRCEGTRRFGFNADSQVTVKNGTCVITGEYLKQGKYGAGWYTGAIALKKLYARGYFEIRCKCNRDYGFWSAFWLQASGDPYDHVRSDGGRQAVEVDIMESYNKTSKSRLMMNTIDSTIHCNGVDDNKEKIDSEKIGTFYINDIFDTYNTYGLMWNEDEYIFYINGKETGRSSFGKGVCVNPEEVIVSLEIPEQLPEEITGNLNYKTQMVVDYVKIYQLAE